MSPYLVIVILNPTKKESEEDNKTPIIVVQPQAVMAKNESHASMRAMRLVPEEYINLDERLEVRLLPFSQRV